MLSFVSILILFIQGCAFTEGPFLTLLVNNVVLATTREQLRRGNRSSSVVYYYGEGDAVDLSCTCQESECDVQVRYDYATMLDDAFQSNYSQYGAGFRLKLQVAHNNSQMTCKCRGCQDDLSVKFILREKFYNILNLKINGLIVRVVKPKPAKRLDILLRKEAYFENGNIHIECDTSEEDFLLHVHTVSDKTVSLLQNETYVKLKTPLEPLNLTFKVYNKKRIKIINQLELKFQLLHFALLDHPQLIVDVPKNSLEFYNFGGQHVIYYEYEDDNSLNLNCSTSFQALQSFVSFIKLDKQGLESHQISPSSIFTEMQLSSNDDGKILQCFLNKSIKDSSSTIQEMWGQARILLHKKSHDKHFEDGYTPAQTIRVVKDKNTPKNDTNIIIYSAAGIATLIVMSLGIFCYQNIRQRRKNSKILGDTTPIEVTAKPLTANPSENIYHTYEVINYAASANKPNRISHRYGNLNQLKKPNTNSDKVATEYCVPYANTINTNYIEPEYCDSRYVNTGTI